MENISKYSYSRKISKSRNHGNVEEAITIALEAKERYPEENIFEKFFFFQTWVAACMVSALSTLVVSLVPKTMFF